MKTEYNPHFNSTKMNMFSSSYNLLSTYECLSSKSQMYFPFITLHWFCSCMILACTIQKLFKICFILINLWFLTWSTLQLTSQVSGDQWNIIQGFPVTLSTDNLQNALADHSSRHGCREMTSYRAYFFISCKCRENNLRISRQEVSQNLFLCSTMNRRWSRKGWTKYKSRMNGTIRWKSTLIYVVAFCIDSTVYNLLI